MREFSTSAGHVAGACTCKQCGGSGASDGDEPLDEEALNRLIDEYGAGAVADALRDIRDGDDHVSGQSGRHATGDDDLVDDYMGRPGALQSLAEDSDTDGPEGYTSYEDIAAAGGEGEGEGEGEGYMDRPGALQSLRDEPESDAVYSPYTDSKTDADEADAGEGDGDGQRPSGSRSCGGSDDDGEVAGYDIGGVLDSLKSDE